MIFIKFGGKKTIYKAMYLEDKGLIWFSGNQNLFSTKKKTTLKI